MSAPANRQRFTISAFTHRVVDAATEITDVEMTATTATENTGDEIIAAEPVATQIPAALLPSIGTAKLPDTYLEARSALEKCSQIDECKDWADRSAALASYARQAGDASLRKLATRIQARAIRRCSELLKQVKPAKNQHDAASRAGRGAPTSRNAVARAAGLSKDQQVQALRVASIPKAEFERLVESDNPPTVTQLAEIGKLQKRGVREHADQQHRDRERDQFLREAAEILESLEDFAERRWPEVKRSGALGSASDHLASDLTIGPVLEAWTAARRCINRRRREQFEKQREQRDRAARSSA